MTLQERLSRYQAAMMISRSEFSDTLQIQLLHSGEVFYLFSRGMIVDSMDLYAQKTAGCSVSVPT